MATRPVTVLGIFPDRTALIRLVGAFSPSNMPRQIKLDVMPPSRGASTA